MYSTVTGWYTSLPTWLKLTIGAAGTAVGVAVMAACGATAAVIAGAVLMAVVVPTVVGGLVSLGMSSAIAIYQMLAGQRTEYTMAEAWQAFSGGIVDSFGLAGATFGIGATIGSATGKLCFTEGTEISAEDGLKPIEEIQVGDKVWAYNEQTGETSLKEVVRLYESEKYNLVEVMVNGEVITSTDTHPYFVQGKGWVRADELKAGDILIDIDDREVVVEGTYAYTSEEPVTVYNFEVQESHTYFVGEQQVLVHNRCGTGADSGNGTDVNQHRMTGKESAEAAKELGFEKTNYKSHGQPVYKKGNKYITPDVDSHNGGSWKMADSVKNLGSKSTRMGTYDSVLNRIGD